MAYDFERLFAKIIASVSGGGAICERMQAIIDECSGQCPHPDWDRMRNIDFAADEMAIPSWLEIAFASPSSKGRKGLWFGLFNPIVAGKPTADIYAAAAPEFDGATINWAEKIDRPHAGSYLRSKVLGAIYSLAYEAKQSLGNDAEYPLALTYGAVVAYETLSKGVLPAVLHDVCGAAVGFDSGDLLFLGDFRDGKFQANGATCGLWVAL